MVNKMTVRLSDEEKKKLEELASAFTYNGVQSKSVRMSIAFTHECFKKLELKKNVSTWDMMELMNKKFKTKIDDWRYR